MVRNLIYFLFHPDVHRKQRIVLQDGHDFRTIKKQHDKDPHYDRGGVESKKAMRRQSITVLDIACCSRISWTTLN